ncbi:MAG: amidohydrolase [Chloroflexi bacterium]|nr:amidohydrolase [Chloroflexota bacterium]MCL5273551.1 amidohydrolase [Chloroflexota bacterium]
MGQLFEVKPVDRQFYEQNLREFLPDRIIDVHTHVWLDRFKNRQRDAPVRTVSWPMRVALDNSLEDLQETYCLMFPGKRVTPQFFSSLSSGDDVDGANAYVSECAARSGYPALIYAAPQWSAESFENRILAGGFSGAKVYMTMADACIPAKEMRIFDYLPHHQLEVLNRHGWIVMLHIPRDGRLKDPVNIAQLLEIERRYPNVQVILAHVGRAYCIEDVGDAFTALAETRRMRFDFSANTNSQVFEALIRAVGPGRILFGSDMPILRMRMRRICEGGIYINLAPRGLYGDVAGDKNMREVDGAEAEQLTFFMYEELDAFRRASETCGLHQSDIEDIFFNNAEQMLRSAGWSGNPA